LGAFPGDCSRTFLSRHGCIVIQIPTSIKTIDSIGFTFLIAKIYWIPSAQTAKIAPLTTKGKVMQQTLTLPDIKITVKGDEIEIRHLKTKTITKLTTKQLERWAIAQLRKELAK
jgi:hypothetical protein